MVNNLEARFFICPQCGAVFKRKAKQESNEMLCRRHKPKVAKGTADCLPCKEKKVNSKKGGG